ncbi:MAG: nucleoside 2-deoxyribosyltransferase [Candidatus Bathyarchaeia archaeon]
MKKSKKIYIAGPLFSEHERSFLEEIAHKVATALGLDEQEDIFLPHRDAGDIGVHGEGRPEIFSSDLKSLDNATIVLALLDGSDVDSGTAVELGYAFARNKEIFGILTDWRRWNPISQKVDNINNMIWGVCKRGERIYQGVNEKFLEDLRRCLG